MKSFPPGFEVDNNNLSIDFDGVIHTFDKGFHDGTCYGDPIEGSLDALKFLSEKYRIVIFTAKAKPDRPLVNGKTGAELVWEWLAKHNVAQYVSEVTSEKPRSFLYIDDNAYRFETWNKTLEFLEHYDKSQ
jgi:hypothetical protein